MQKQAMEEKALMKELNRYFPSPFVSFSTLIISIREKKEKQLKREAYEKRALEETLLKRKEAENLINQLAASKTSTKLDEIIQSNRQKNLTCTFLPPDVPHMKGQKTQSLMTSWPLC